VTGSDCRNSQREVRDRQARSCHLGFCRISRPPIGLIMPLAALTLVLVSVLLAVPLVAETQQAAKVYRIGYLRYYGCSEPAQFTELRQGLGELGYAEGHNLVIECRAARGRAERIHDLAAELVRLNVDVIVAEGTASALAAKQATRAIPIVMVYIADPVGSGLVGSLGRPGGNVTGSTMLAPDIVRKSLQLLKEAVPAISRVTVLIDSSNPGQTLPDQQMAAAAEVLGVRPQRADLVKSSDLDKACAAVLRQRAQALLVYPLPLTSVEFQGITEFAIRNRLPTATWHPPYVREGLLMFYETNVPEQFRRAGVHIDKILKGAKPADLPVEQPTKSELGIT
jgi:putative ABC transport system substrate-binding protein